MVLLVAGTASDWIYLTHTNEKVAMDAVVQTLSRRGVMQALDFCVQVGYAGVLLSVRLCVKVVEKYVPSLR